MQPKTKIMVFKSKELIYTGIFVLMGILLIVLLIFMFKPKKDKSDITTSETSTQNESTEELSTDTQTTYSPGVYSATMNLGGYDSVVSVTVTDEGVSHVDIQNTNETVTAMYPLLDSALDDINSQLESNIPLEDINYSSEKQYTSVLIIEAVKQALNNK